MKKMELKGFDWEKSKFDQISVCADDFKEFKKFKKGIIEVETLVVHMKKGIMAYLHNGTQIILDGNVEPGTCLCCFKAEKEFIKK